MRWQHTHVSTHVCRQQRDTHTCASRKMFAVAFIMRPRVLQISANAEIPSSFIAFVAGCSNRAWAFATNFPRSLTTFTNSLSSSSLLIYSRVVARRWRPSRTPSQLAENSPIEVGAFLTSDSDVSAAKGSSHVIAVMIARLLIVFVELAGTSAVANLRNHSSKSNNGFFSEMSSA